MAPAKRSPEAARRWSEYVLDRYRESGDRSYTAFARRVNVQHRTLFRWIEDGIEPSASLVERFARNTGRPEPEVREAAGMGPATAGGLPTRPELEDSADADSGNPLSSEVVRMLGTPVRYIPIARGSVSAGRHAFQLTDDVVPIGADDLPYRELVAVAVVGSCMEPEIRAGSMVFVDLSRRDALAGEIVVVLTDDGDVLVKRVAQSTGGLVLVDNQGGRFRPAEAVILGIVVGTFWTGRRRS